MESELSKFKHILEYFVTHLNFKQSGNSDSVLGFHEYLKPLIDNGSFQHTGQGWKEDSIQKQISQWDDICSHHLCISIQPNYGKYNSKKCYLNWKGTGINVFCNWNGNKVISLQLGYSYWWKDPTEYKIKLERSISELGLFEESGDTTLLEEFFNLFIHEITDYDQKKGDYYFKEQEYEKQIKQEQMDKHIQLYLNLLRSTHNLILTGAPGTGKTYLAKQIAAQMILGKEYDENCEEDKKIIDEQCGFVQFHPSYDYTDFVEGLRPIQDENGNVGFERKDGVFKAFCAKAVEKFETKGFDEAFDKLLESVSDEKMTLKTTKGNEFAIAANSRGNLILFTGKNFQQNGVLTRERVKAEFLGKPMDQWWKSYYRGVADYLEREFNLKKVAASPNRPFVFIIDEINRGEISKIFGELFFSIDPGYRGEKDRVQTQYQNLVEDGNVFKKGFFVPKNVYIIGTMNDIDRSVESMDFAFRRRFAFKEIKADAEISISMLDKEEAWGKDENNKSLKPDENTINIIKEKMSSLNNMIWHKPIEGESDESKSIEGLSSAYHIGASYFLKLANYMNNDGTYDFDMLWEYHLEGLLFEYLRGTTDIDKSMKKLAEAYGYTKSNKYETTSNN